MPMETICQLCHFAAQLVGRLIVHTFAQHAARTQLVDTHTV